MKSFNNLSLGVQVVAERMEKAAGRAGVSQWARGNVHSPTDKASSSFR